MAELSNRFLGQSMTSSSSSTDAPSQSPKAVLQRRIEQSSPLKPTTQDSKLPILERVEAPQPKAELRPEPPRYQAQRQFEDSQSPRDAGYRPAPPQGFSRSPDDPGMGRPPIS